MSVYLSRGMKYAVHIFKMCEETNIYSAYCNAVVNEQGKEVLLHNEIDFVFDMKEDEIHIISGYHIGTEDFGFSEKDGDDCIEIIERYHPGLISQVKEMM